MKKLLLFLVSLNFAAFMHGAQESNIDDIVKHLKSKGLEFQKGVLRGTEYNPSFDYTYLAYFGKKSEVIIECHYIERATA